MKIKFKKQVVCAFLVLLVAALSGCTALPGSSGKQPGSANTPSGTASKPGVIHFPEVNSAKWVTSVASLCIQVQQTYNGVSGHHEPIAEELQGIFERIGVQATIGEGSGCEAVLALTLQFTPVAENVIGAGDCYLDAESTGEAALSAEGHKTLTLPLEHKKSSGGGWGFSFISKCPGPAEAPFDSAWGAGAANMLAEWWGSPALVSALKSDTSTLRSSASYQLSAMGAEASGAIPVLVEMLGDTDSQTRAAAASALGGFGKAAGEAVPALIESVNDSDEQVQYAVIGALGAIGDNKAIPALITALHHSNDYTRYVAALALEKFGPAAAPAVPDLVSVLNDDFAQVGSAAVDALAAIGPGAKEACPDLIKLLEIEKSPPHFIVADALESITGQKFGEDAAAWRSWWESQR